MSSVKHLIFIDENLSDISILIENLPENSEWFKLDNETDGILQIDNITKDYNNLESVQIVTHGNSGSLSVGSTSLTNSNLLAYQPNLSSIGESLSEKGDFLIYGCNVASGEDGKKLITGIAEYSLADVAASIDLTGPTDLGGDSVLEFQTGGITSPVISTESLSEVLWNDTTIASDISTQALEDKLKEYNNDSVYDYLEMRTLLETAAQGGITSAEFNDLKTAYQKIEAANAFKKDTDGGTDSYVQYITYGAIHAHPANAKWWGGATKMNQVETLGNMQAGMSQDKATKLIKKWFYGEDLPMPVAGGDTANPDAASAVGKYATSNGVMFKADINTAANTSSTTPGVLVTADDMAQGQAGTCWILACLQAVAHVGTGTSDAGKAIENLIIDPITTDKIWGMKFYNSNKEAVYVTVNSDIAIKDTDVWYQKDSPIFALNAETKTITAPWGQSYTTWSNGTPITKNLHGELWAGLFEKGYAQANSYLANRGGQGENSYLVMEGGSAIGFKHLTGKDIQWYHGSSDMYKYSNVEQATTQVIADALAAGAVGYVGGRKNSTDPVTGKKQMVKGHAHALINYDPATQEFLIRNPWGGENTASRDMEWWAPLSEITSAANPNSIFLTDPITIAKNYSYTITSDAKTSGAAKEEGKSITFTITRNNVGDETTVYLSTASGASNGADGNDFKAYSKSALTFGKQETTKNFVVETYNDASTEGSNGVENFKLELFTKSTQGTATVSETAYIKDKAQTNYNYSITSNAGSSDPITEGGKVTFTITRAKASNSDADKESTVYLNTANDTASSFDYDSLKNYKVDFKIFQTSQNVTVTTKKDTSDEGNESFKLNLYKSLADSNAGGTPAAHSAGYIKDVVAPSYDYSITSNAGTSNEAIDEGKIITFTITRSGSGTASKVYVSTNNKSAVQGDDFEGFSDKLVTFKANQKTKTVEVNTKLDTWLETKEFFELGLYKDVNTKDIVASGSAFIKDGDYKADYYSITNSSTAGGDSDGISTSADLNDDDFIATATTGASSFTLGGTKTLSGKVVTVFSAANDSTAKFTITGTKAAKDLNGDGDTTDTGEGAGTQTEVIWGVNNGTAVGKKIFETVTGVTVDKAVAGSVKVGVSGGDLTINGALNGGGTATLDGKFVSIKNAGNNSSVKFEVTGTDTSDAALKETIFGGSQETVTGTKLFKTVTKISAVGATDGNIEAGVIGDGTDEGKDVTFTINRTNVNNAADTIYLSTAPGTAKETDFEGFSGKEVKFAAFETQKTVTVKAKSDSENDDNEYFWLNMYLNKTAFENNESVVNNKAYIDHVTVPTQYSYAITSDSAADNSNTKKEGEEITFTITRTKTGGSDAPTTIFVNTISGTADNEDYTPIETTALNFGKKEKQKTIKVKTKTDALGSEGTETFNLAAYTTADDAANENITASWQYNKAFIKNVAPATNYTYTVKSSADYDNPVEEGNEIIFTITRSGTGSASTVYVSTTQGVADPDDYTAFDSTPLIFAAQQTTKTVKVSTVADTLTEGKEFFYLDLYKSVEDAENGNYSAWDSGYIKDKAGSAAADYTYTITSSHANPNLSDAVDEGKEATFTITRTLANNATASAATVYVSTRDGTATTQEEDYQSFFNQAIDFKKDELSKEFTVPTFSDSATDNGEYFFLELYKNEVSDVETFNSQEEEPAAWGKAFIKNDDTASSNASAYNYSIISSNYNYENEAKFTISDAGNISADTTITVQKNAESAVTFTAKSSGASGQQFNINSSANTTASNLASAINAHSSFTATASGSEVIISVTGGGTPTVTTTDPARMTVSNSAAKEGEQITFTITRARDDGAAISGSDKASTVYVSTTEGSAYSDDYQSFSLKEVEFKKDETVKTVTVDTIVDTITETGGEYFWFDLFKSKADADELNYHAWAEGHIKDDASLASSIGNYKYSITSSHGTDGNGIKEGGEVTFTITRARTDDAAIGNSDVKSTVYVSTTEGTAYEDDYTALNLKKIKFKKTETTKVVKVKTKKDGITDDNEFFYLDLFKTKADAENLNYAAWSEGYIKDDAGSTAAAATYEYEVNKGAKNSTSTAVKEGSDVVFTITRTNTGGGAESASTIYISTSAGSASNDDFEVITNKAIEFKANELTKQVSVKTKKDAETDDNEYFWFDVYKSLEAAENFEYYQWDKGYISDDASAANALNNYTYAITSTHTPGNGVTEGGLATFTITRTKVSGDAVAATVYVATSEGTADSDDYEAITKQAVDFKKDELTKTVTVQTKEDAVADDNEIFALELYLTEGDWEDGEYNTYGKAAIANSSSSADAVSNYTYTVTGQNKTTGTAASEGSDVTFTVTRARVDGNAISNSDIATKVYISTTHSTTDSEDFVSLDKKIFEFQKDETTKTITISTLTDDATEGTESFFLDLFKTKTDAEEGNYEAWDYGYIKDNSTAAQAANQYFYEITTTAGKLDPVTEGSNITFTVTRKRTDGKEIKYGQDMASTVYIGTQDSSATAEDYFGIPNSTISSELKFGGLEKTKTITVETFADDKTEQDESFYLGLFKTKGALNSYIETADESLVDAFAAGYMKDPVGVGTYTYTITNNSPTNSAKAEGTDITVTITRNVSGTAGESTIFLSTTESDAGEDDYVAVNASPVKFTSSDADGAQKQVTIKTLTDSDASEGKESFFVDLFKTKADAENGEFFEYTTAYIADAAAAGSASRTYTIDNDSKANSKNNEGTTVTFTVTVNNTSAASTVWVSTIDGTAIAGEDYVPVLNKEVNFAQGGSTSQTVTVNLLNDVEIDPDETFSMEVYKSKQDAENGIETAYSKAVIKDTSATKDYDYKITSKSASTVTEGGSVTFTIKRYEEGTGSNKYQTLGTEGDSVVFLKISGYGTTSDIDGTDFASDTNLTPNINPATDPIPFTFADGEHTATYTVETIKDSKVEAAAGFWFDVYSKEEYAVTDQWGKTDSYTGVTISQNTTSVAPPNNSGNNSDNCTYTIDNTNSILGNSGMVIEGNDATFTISRSCSGFESTIYLSTFISNEEGYASSSDFQALDHYALTFDKDEMSKEISISTILDDDKSEANESFYLRMNKGATGETFESGVYDKVTITQPTGMLGTQLLGGNSGALAGTDTVTVTAASKTYFPGYQNGQFLNDFAFSAPTNAGKVVSWGNSTKGGDSSSVSSHLTTVSKIYSNSSAFAAVKDNGSVVSWGNPDAGGTSWDSDGLTTISTLGSNGALTLGGASTSAGSATFSKGNKVTITSEGDDSGGYFWIVGTDTSDNSQTVKLAGGNAGTVETAELFKTVASITFKNGNTDSATGQAATGKVNAGNLFSPTYSIASDINGTKKVTKISSTADAFAAVRDDGSVITWGNSSNGGDSRSVSSSLDGSVNVRDIYSNMSAFAALREDGSVITWGYDSFGGNSSSVANKITNKSHSDFSAVTDISATGSAFAALRSDGSVITWGNTQDGGDSSGVASSLNGSSNPTDVVQIYATTSAFAALQKNGAVITWGDVNNGGSSSSVSSSLNGQVDVTKIFSTGSAFAALKSDGSLITWGNASNGGNSTSVANDLNGTTDITKVFSTNTAFAAINTNNKVITWGYGAYGGDSSSVTSLINGTLDSDCITTAASVSANGTFNINGDLTSSNVATFANTEKISITSAGDDSARTFTVTGTNSAGATQTETITGSNAGVATGTKYFKTVTKIQVDSGGGTAGTVKAGVVNKEVKTIVSTDKAFAALLKDGTVVTWGDSGSGGDSSSVSGKLIMSADNSSTVTQLSASSGAFTAIKSDSKVVTWGNSDLGGDSSGVDFANNPIQGMSGSSSGSECTVNCGADTSKKVGSASLTLKDSGGNAVSGTFITGSDGKLDFTNVSDGTYTASYKLTDSQSDSIINALDVSGILDISSGLNGSPTNKQKLASDLNGDGNINALDVSAVLDLSSGLDNSGATAVLRDASASNPFSTTSFSVSSGSDITLSAYVLGDINGTYADIL